MSTEFEFQNGTLTATRIYDAPRDLVFEAWIETEKIQRWWGCAQCVAVESEVEPRVGGKYNHHMTIEGVGRIPGQGTLVEYDPPNRLAYESDSPMSPSQKMVVTVEFTSIDGGTQVRMQHSGIPDVRVDGGIEMREIIQGGWTAALEKLNQLFVSTAN